jgi:hypothetical protein
MPIAVMAETAEAEPGAKIAKDAIDPELVKLRRKPLRIGPITCAGIVFLSVLSLWHMNPDRKFAGSSSEPHKVAVADIVAGKVAVEQLVAIDAQAEPLMSHAIRTAAAKGTLGLRVVPVRGTGDKLWLVIGGDGWDQPQLAGYIGRLREMGDLPFATAANEYLASHPEPVFAAAPAVRAGFSTGKITGVSGEEATLRDSDRVAFELTDPDAAIIVGTFNKDANLANAMAWQNALGNAGIVPHGEIRATEDVARFEVALPDAVATLRDKLVKAELWGGRVEPVTHHFETTWGALKGSSPAGFVVGGTTIPDAQVDLVGLYVERAIPSGAYALITGDRERPERYWYMLPVTIAVIAIGLLFAWALVRAIRRDMLTPPADTAA